MSSTMRFDDVLEAVEQLTMEDQAELIEVVRRRLVERGRKWVIEEVREGRAEFERGETKVTSVDELMREIELG